MCNLNNVVALMSIMAVLIAAAIAAAAASLAIPWPWDAAILVGATAAAAGALAMVNVIESAFQDYRTCRDQEDDLSQCNTTAIDGLFGHLNALRVLMGIAVAGFASAAAAALIPFVGKLVGQIPLQGAWIACLIAVALLISLLAFLLMYANCRDQETQANGPGGPGTIVEPGGGIVSNVNRQPLGRTSSKSSDTQK